VLKPVLFPGNQLRQLLRTWLSPADPSTNHNIARKAQHGGTAVWLFQGGIVIEWKSTGSLLWIHGKRAFLLAFFSSDSLLLTDSGYHSGLWEECYLVRWSLSPSCRYLFSASSSVIQDVMALCETGSAIMAYFYFDFRDLSKQTCHDLLLSLVTQLSTRFGPYCDILHRIYKTHENGTRQPSDDILKECLKEMLRLPIQLPVFIILDALDECPDSSGIPSPRDEVLELVKELVDLHLRDLHICAN
jgi:hypothetical protein